MKTMAKLAIGALMTCGLAVAAAAPAEAGVHVGIGIGLPIVGPAYGSCYGYGDPYYYCGPGYVGGLWYGHDRAYWGAHGGWNHGG